MDISSQSTLCVRLWFFNMSLFLVSSLASPPTGPCVGEKPSGFGAVIRGQDLQEGRPSGRRASQFHASTAPRSLVVRVVSVVLSCAGERSGGKP